MNQLYRHGYKNELAILNDKKNNEVLTRTKRAVVIKNRSVKYGERRTRYSAPIVKKTVYKIAHVYDADADKKEAALVREVSRLNISPRLLKTYTFVSHENKYRVYIHECCHDVRWSILAMNRERKKIEKYVETILRKLRSHGIVYLDLKIENTINCKGEIKLIDFERAYSFKCDLSEREWSVLIILQKLLFSLGTYDYSGQLFFCCSLRDHLQNGRDYEAVSRVLEDRKSGVLPPKISKMIQLLIRNYARKTVFRFNSVDGFLRRVRDLHATACAQI